jgi:hypothetical protein
MPLRQEPAKPSAWRVCPVCCRAFSGVRQDDDLSAAGRDLRQSVDRAGVGGDAVVQHAILLDQEEVELICDLA